MDIRHAFNRIRVHGDSEELTTFRTRLGAYYSKVLPFGLTNGPATFQRYINHVLFDCLDDFCTAYVDDILIYSESVKDHQKHVEAVLGRLRDAGLQVDLRKSEFHVLSTKFLGFIVTAGRGISMDLKKVETIRN